MKVALGQFGAGADKQQNLRRMQAFTAEAAAAGAELVLFPEAAMVVRPQGESLAPHAEPVDGPFVAGLRQAAQQHKVALAAGMFEPADQDRVYNTVVAIGADGRLLGSYRKIHLYDAFGHRESERIKPGDGETLVVEHGDLRVGVMTCYEVRFPEMARRLAEQGAELILLPAAWVRGPLKEMHWDTLARARAIENTVYVAAAGQVGSMFTGLSAIYDPMGVAIVSAGEAEGLAIAEVTRERLAEVRRANPSLSMRRPDVYSGWQLVRA